MAKLWDNPRPQGYWPGTPTQWREPSVDDCTWYATEFLFEAASETHLSMHPVRDIRANSTDTDGGTPLAVALRDTAAIWPDDEGVTYEYIFANRQQITNALASGAGILWGGDYERLPPHYRRWTNNDVFNHAMASLTLDIGATGTERTFLYDPLGGGPEREPYDGEWIKIHDILDFNWGDGGYPVGIVKNKGDYTMQKLNLPFSQKANRAVGLRRGAAARSAPMHGSDVVRRFWTESKRYPFLAKFRNGWFLVLWKGDENDWDFGYVHKDDIKVNEWVGVPPVDDTDVAALKLANKALASDNAALNNRMDTALIQADKVVQTLSE